MKAASGAAPGACAAVLTATACAPVLITARSSIAPKDRVVETSGLKGRTMDLPTTT
jgi:hypothetical protein